MFAPKIAEYPLMGKTSLLKKVDELREKDVGQYIPLPQLVVVGDQSSGKSSLLETLTGIAFPRNVGLCTRFATQITSRHDPDERLEISILPGPKATQAHREKLAKYRPILAGAIALRDQFSEIMQEVSELMGVSDSSEIKATSAFSEDILKIEVCGPDEEYLTVIDVPGLFESPEEGVTTAHDVEVVREMVTSYIKEKQTVILVVLPATADVATQKIVRFAEEYDKTGERTLAVFTKPDILQEDRTRAAVCDTVLGKRRQLTLGYHVICNRDADSDGVFDFDRAERMFDKSPWNKLPKDRVGVAALRSRLAELLDDVTRREFPELRRKVQEQMQASKTELSQMGPSRQDEQAQRQYLGEIARRFERLTQAALDAQYHTDDSFETDERLRLITRVVNLTEQFNDDFERKGHSREFDRTSSNDPTREDWSENEEDVKPRLKHRSARTTATEDVDLQHFSTLLPIITSDFDVEEPTEGIIEWTKELYIRSRGVELATFGGSILSSAFRDQSSKWSQLTQLYVSRVIVLVHHFITSCLDRLCPDEYVRGEIWSDIEDEIMQRYRAGLDGAKRLISIERNNRPYTLNHYFNETLQSLTNERLVQILRSKSRREVTGGKNN